MSIVPQLIVNSIIAGATYSLIGLGFNLSYSTTKFFNLAHGVLAAVGGYTVFYLMRTWNLPLVVAIIIALLVSGLIGVLLDKLIYFPLRKRKASNLVLLIASLGAFTVIQALLAIIFTSQFQTLADPTVAQKVYNIGGGIITQTQMVIIVSGLLIMIALALTLKYTMFGKAIKAIGDDEEVAEIVGINTNRTISWVFFISSVTAAWAGIMVGFDTGIEPIMGLPLLLSGIIGSIIGGIGNIYGAVLGAFVLGFAENFGIWHLSGEWKSTIAYVLLLLFLIFRPQGLLKR